MNRVLILGFILLSGNISFGQSGRLTLQQAIETAIDNNSQVKQSGLQSQVAEVSWKQSKANLLPSFNAQATHGINQGRNIDPFTNSYVDQKINFANYGINSGIVLFNGLSLQNSIRQTALGYEASKSELQQAKDNVTINVMLAYLQVLSNEDVLAVARNQAAVTKKQLDRLEVLNKQGAINPPLVADLKGQLMSDELSVVNAKNALEQSKLLLSQLMNQGYDANLQLERINADEFLAAYSKNADAVYQKALSDLSMIKAVDLRTKSAQAGLRSARGELFPTLSLNGNVSSYYSSSQQNIKYNDQLNNNLFSTVSLGLRIPILNAFQTRNRIKLAQINIRSMQLVAENTKLQLHQAIDQAYMNMTNASDRLRLSGEQVKAYEESFHAAEIRFNAGVGTSVDYVLAKNNLDRANINLVMAKYDFVLRKKVLDFYSGELK